MVDKLKGGLGIRDLIGDKSETIKQLAHEYGASNIRIFGSVARGEATQTSDIDFVMTFEPDCSLIHYVGLIQALEALLGHKVDIVRESNNLSEQLRTAIASDAIWL